MRCAPAGRPELVMNRDRPVQVGVGIAGPRRREADQDQTDAGTHTGLSGDPPATSAKKYISLKQVVPLRDHLGDREPRAVGNEFLMHPTGPAGQICSFSQVISGRSSARPRNSVIDFVRGH